MSYVGRWKIERRFVVDDGGGWWGTLGIQCRVLSVEFSKINDAGWRGVAGILNIAEYSIDCAISPDLDRQTLLFSRFGSKCFLFALFWSTRFLLPPIRI